MLPAIADNPLKKYINFFSGDIWQTLPALVAPGEMADGEQSGERR
jgi:hypothetical protein